MSLAVVCFNCKQFDHARCLIGHTRKGVLGGWTCSCQSSVCVARRKRRSTTKAEDD